MKGQNEMEKVYNFNYNNLRVAILDQFKTYQKFAEEMGCVQCTLCKKLKRTSAGFSQQEIIKIIELLHIEKEEIPKYFFDYIVK
jgi:hypothetical protein